jgi:hypothetical protein
MRLAVALALLGSLVVAPSASPRPTAVDRCGTGAVNARLGSMVAGLNNARGDRFAAGFAPTGRWHPYTSSIRPPGVVGRRQITYLAVLSIGSEVEWTLSRLRRTSRDRYTVTVTVTAHDQPAGRGSTTLRVNCASGLVRSWVGPAMMLPPPVDDD